MMCLSSSVVFLSVSVIFHLSFSWSVYFFPAAAVSYLKNLGDFPGGLVVKTPHSQCRNMGLIPGLGTKMWHGVA